MQLRNQWLVISTLTFAEMKARYRNTVAGVLWVMLNPLFMFGVHALIFKHILKIDVSRYYVFLLSGLLPWLFINSALTQTVNCFISLRDALLSFQIHPLSLILSKCLDCFFNFLLPFIFLFAFLFEKENFNLYGVLSLPLSFLILIIGVSSLSTIFAILQVFFRDTQYLVNFLLSVMFFLTPIFYPRHLIPKDYQILVDINPFFALINSFKIALWNYSDEKLISALLIGGSFAGALYLIALFLWKKTRNELYINI